MIRKIVQAEDPRLRKVSKPVGKVDKKIHLLITDLKETCVPKRILKVLDWQRRR